MPVYPMPKIHLFSPGPVHRCPTLPDHHRLLYPSTLQLFFSAHIRWIAILVETLPRILQVIPPHPLLIVCETDNVFMQPLRQFVDLAKRWQSRDIWSISWNRWWEVACAWERSRKGISDAESVLVLVWERDCGGYGYGERWEELLEGGK